MRNQLRLATKPKLRCTWGSINLLTCPDQQFEAGLPGVGGREVGPEQHERLPAGRLQDDVGSLVATEPETTKPP